MKGQLRLGAGALAASLAVAASAIAATPLKSRVYAGQTAKEERTITLTVAKSGKTVKASVPFLPLYCQGGGPPNTQVTAPATISKSGSFSGTIKYLYKSKVIYKAHFSGRFVKKTLAKGSLRSEYKEASCNGTTTWTAKPAAAL